MTQAATLWDTRMARLTAVAGAIEVVRRPELNAVAPLVAVTSSRLGHDLSLHRQVCRFLCRSMMDCRARGGAMLVASGSAIEPWAMRAAELFGIRIIRVLLASDRRSPAGVNARKESEMVFRASSDSNLSRDELLIALADRVDAVYVRRGGTIDRCLRDRIYRMDDASTRVAISMRPKCAAADLVADGAIGWFLPTDNLVRPVVPEANLEDDSDAAWARTDGQWLVHCTRGCNGAWPGETERQYRDSILLGSESSIARGPLDALLRIIRGGRIVAGGKATKKECPVVCFSALPLAELVQRRCFRPQLGRWDYEPYGIAIRLETARSIGIEPVIYGEPKDRVTLPPEDRYRFHPVGQTFDWRSEREWRSRANVDITGLNRDDIRIFAEDTSEARTKLVDCPWRVTFLTPTRTEDLTADRHSSKRV